MILTQMSLTLVPNDRWPTMLKESQNRTEVMRKSATRKNLAPFLTTRPITNLVCLFRRRISQSRISQDQLLCLVMTQTTSWMTPEGRSKSKKA